MEALIVLVVVFWVLTALGRLLANLGQAEPAAPPWPMAPVPPQTPARQDPVWEKTPDYPVSSHIEVLPQGAIYCYPEGRFRVVVTVAKDQETPAGRLARICKDGARRIELGSFNTWSEAWCAYEQKGAGLSVAEAAAGEEAEIARQEAPAPEPDRLLAEGIVHALGTTRRTLNGKEFEHAYLDVRLKSGQTKRVWGEDLPRALEASQASQGDRIRVLFQGKQKVSVEEDGVLRTAEKRIFLIQRLA